MNSGVQAWSIFWSEDVLRPDTRGGGVKERGRQQQRSGFSLDLSVEGLRLSLQVAKLHLDEVGQGLPHFQLKSNKNTITMETPRGLRGRMKTHQTSRVASSFRRPPSPLTWLLFSARRDSTSSFTLNGLPTRTVTLWKGQTRAPTSTRVSRQPPRAVCVLPSRSEGCRASRWAGRRSDLKTSTVIRTPPAASGRRLFQQDRTPALVLTHVPERQDDGMEGALG